MKIQADSHGDVSLRLSDDKSHAQLLMEFDPQLECFQITLQPKPDGDMEPQDPVRRREGEDDEVFFDRAAAMAHRIYLNHVTALIEAQSRNDRKHHLFRQIRDKLTHMDLVIEHFDNDEPTEEDLMLISSAFSQLRDADANLQSAT